MDKYIVKWYDDSNREHTLTIYDTESQTDNTTNLIPGVSPFVSREDADTNPFTSVRTKTATINILTENLPQLNLTSSHRYRVVLVCGSQVEWLGWVSANVMNQDYNSYLGEFSLNAIDDLQALSTWKLDATLGFDIVSLGSILAECFGHTNGVSVGDAYTHLYWPNEYMSLNVYGSSGKIWTDIEVSRFNFFSPAGDNSEDDYVGDDCLTVVQKICTFFGFSLRLIGNKLYFSKIGTTTYFGTNDIANLFSGTYTSSNFTFSSTAKTSLPTPTETDHQINVEQGKREITIKADINEVSGSVVPSLDFSNSKIEWITPEATNIQYGGLDRSVQWKWMIRYLTPINKKVKLHKYMCWANPLGTDNAVQEYYIRELTVPLKLQQDAMDGNYTFEYFGGAHLISHDGWQLEQGWETKKINYDFSTRLILTSMMPTYMGIGHRTQELNANSKPLLEAEGDGVALMTNGGFEIAFKLHTPYIDSLLVWGAEKGVGVNKGGWIGPYTGGIDAGVNKNDLYRSRTRLQCVFSVGDLYWNGTTWSSTPSTFFITCESENQNMVDIITNKRLDMDFTATNYVMPINRSLTGIIKFKILKSDVIYSDGRSGTGIRDLVFVEGLAVNYCPPISMTSLDTENEGKHIYSAKNEGWTDDLEEVQLSINSDNNDQDSYSQLIFGNHKIVTFTYNGIEKRPEEHLLEAYQKEFSVSRTILELYVEANDESTPLTYIEQGGKKFVCIAEGERDYTTNKKKLIYREF